jgi:hypothetical protein
MRSAPGLDRVSQASKESPLLRTLLHQRHPQQSFVDAAVVLAALEIRTAGPGRHSLVFTAADYQELKNMENVPQILPNTRTFRAAFRVG